MNAKLKCTSGLLSIGLSLLLMACERGEYKDLKAYIETTRAAAENKQKTLIKPVPELPKVASYQASVLRTPFESESILSNKKVANANPLLTYPLNMLRFVGTISLDGTIFAFIMAPDNKVYQARTGDRIGDREAKITTIQADSITLMEQVAEPGKPTMQRMLTLQLKDAHS